MGHNAHLRNISYQYTNKTEEQSFKYTSRFVKSPYHLYLRKGMVIHLNKLQSPLSKDALHQVWLKLA